MENATGWIYSESGTNLTVTDIDTLDPDASTSARIYLSQDFYATGDFAMEGSIAWDSLGNNSAMQDIDIRVYNGSELVASCGYTDPRYNDQGAKKAWIGEENYVSSHTLLLSGGANVKIIREAGIISCMWNDDIILSRANTSPIDSVSITFRENTYSLATFGTLSIDQVSAIPEPTTILLLGLGGLILKSRK